jgi:hypothetical protein
MMMKRSGAVAVKKLMLMRKNSQNMMKLQMTTEEKMPRRQLLQSGRQSSW